MIDNLVTGLKAAGEPTRLRILRLLAEQDLTVSELTQILGQSQPRVSRHLKLLAEAGLIERLPEGAWAFFRLIRHNLNVNGHSKSAALSALIVDQVDLNDPIIVRDLERLADVKAARASDAASYFRANAEKWGRLRSLHVPEADVERSIAGLVRQSQAQTLIDIGTGTGRILELLSPLVGTGTGLDVSHEMLTVARSNLSTAGIENCQVQYADVYALPFEPECADLVTIHQVLHYLPDPGQAITQAARLLKPGGEIIIVDFEPHELEFLRTDHAHHRLGFAHADINDWCRAAGLIDIETESFPPPHDVDDKLTVSIWHGRRPSDKGQKS